MKVFWFFFSKKNRLLTIKESKRFFLKKEAKTSLFLFRNDIGYRHPQDEGVRMMKQIFAEPDEANLDHLIFSDDPVISAFAQWLVTEAEPDDWHRVADGWNWDRGEDPLWWIVTRPNCDKATALMVFWLTKPYQHLGQPAWEAMDVEDYDLYHTIRARWAAGFYTRSELAYDTEHDADPIDFAAYKRRYGNEVDAVMPPGMRYLNGRRIIGMGFKEGIPLAFWDVDEPFEEEDEDA